MSSTAPPVSIAADALPVAAGALMLGLNVAYSALTL